MDVPAWALVVIVVAAILLMAFAILRRVNAGAETDLAGGFWRFWTAAPARATIDKSTSRTGGASAVATGDAAISETEVEKDLTAHAGVQPEDPTQDPKGR